MTHNNATDAVIAQAQQSGYGRRWHIVGWMIVGILLGVLLAGLFFAYGQPELLLEQMNLRYCG
jgi:hypothetical protein